MPETYRFLILLAAHNVLWGWILSCAGRLGAPGYLLSFAFFPLLYLAVGSRPREMAKIPGEFRAQWQRWKNRARRRSPLPLLFLALALLVILGGLLYVPSNYDGLSYRVPRMLHWLAEGGWHVVQTPNERINFQGATWEWVGLPLVAFTGSERFLWVSNVIAWLAMPGLFFSFLRWLGVGSRTGWVWMWVFPSAFGFVLQAASIGNDIFGAALALASLYFGARFRRSSTLADFACGMFAVALVTGVKISNLPLALPWLVLVAPGLPAFLSVRRGLACAGLAVVSAIISVVPIAAVNQVRAGDFTGAPLMGDVRSATDPKAGIAGNAILLSLQSLAPPVLPIPKAKIDELFVRVLPSPLQRFLAPHFETSFTSSGLGELQIEESAGLGLGVSAALLLSVVTAIPNLRRRKHPLPWATWILAGSIVISAAAFLAKAGMIPAGRLFAPYYPSLIAIILLIFPTTILWKTKFGRLVSIVALLFSMLVVILTPARPLFPAITLLEGAARMTNSPQIARALDVYKVYRDRPFMYAPMLSHLPASAKEVGLIVMGDEPETSLWRPFGSRRLKHLVTGRTLTLPDKLPEYTLVSSYGLSYAGGTLSELLEKGQADIVDRKAIRFRVSSDPVEWLVLKTKTSSAN